MLRSWPIWIFAALALVATAAFSLRVIGWGALADVVEEVSLPDTEVIDVAALSDDDLRARARQASCVAAVPMWWTLAARQPDNLEAYKSIANCSQRRGIEGVLADTRGAFEESRVLALVPRMLDELQVKDLVPILDEVKVKQDKTALDYLFLSRALDRLGDPKGSIDALKDAMSLDPKNPDMRFELGHLLVAQGRIDESRRVFRSALERGGTQMRMAKLYAAGVAYPYSFLFLMFAMIGFGGVVATRPKAPYMGALTDALDVSQTLARATLLGASAFGGTALALLFHQTADRAAFALLTLVAAASVIWLVASPLRSPIRQLATWTGGILSAIVQGQIYRHLGGRSTGEQFAVLLATLVILVFFVPLIPSADIRIATLALLGLLLVSSLGTLMLGILDHLGSLRITLQWLAVAGTLPFLLFFMNLERERLLIAWSTRDAWAPLLGYAVVWGMGVLLALLLARILSRSILSPLDDIMSTITAIRAGDFDARTSVSRSDEIGQLATAVDDMAAGLAQREHIKDTFRQYVDPAVAEMLMSQNIAMDSGREMRATVLFSDVRGFTRLSEGLEPAEVLDILNDYFSRMAPIVQRWGGVVDKYIGDGMMAVWGAPEPVNPKGEHAGTPETLLAVRAALEMLDALQTFNNELDARGLSTLAIGIGINEGPLIAGPLGSEDRREYTVIGDTVNTAARFESVARGEHPLVVGATVADQISPHVHLEALPPMRLKGKANTVPVWSIRGSR